MRKFVTIIIPTLAARERRESLMRAIDSIASQKGIDALPLVVVNGNRFDPDLVEALRRDTRVEVAYISEPSYPAAVRHGRLLVRSEAFGFLDDDDWLLPDTLQFRVDKLIAEQVDVLVTTGLGYQGQVVLRDADAVNRDPIGALLQQTWFASCAGLFRASTVAEDFFDGKAKYNEWTLLAFKLVHAGKRILFVNVPTFKLEDTPQSLSKERNPEALQQILDIHVYMYERAEARHRPQLRRHIVMNLHMAADYHRSVGNLALAWRYHARSVALGGWRHLAFTRHLIAAAFHRKGGIASPPAAVDTDSKRKHAATASR